MVTNTKKLLLLIIAFASVAATTGEIEVNKTQYIDNSQWFSKQCRGKCEKCDFLDSYKICKDCVEGLFLYRPGKNYGECLDDSTIDNCLRSTLSEDGAKPTCIKCAPGYFPLVENDNTNADPTGALSVVLENEDRILRCIPFSEATKEEQERSIDGVFTVVPNDTKDKDSNPAPDGFIITFVAKLCKFGYYPKETEITGSVQKPKKCSPNPTPTTFPITEVEGCGGYDDFENIYSKSGAGSIPEEEKRYGSYCTFCLPGYAYNPGYQYLYKKVGDQILYYEKQTCIPVKGDFVGCEDLEITRNGYCDVCDTDRGFWAVDIAYDYEESYICSNGTFTVGKSESSNYGGVVAILFCSFLGLLFLGK